MCSLRPHAPHKCINERVSGLKTANSCGETWAIELKNAVMKQRESDPNCYDAAV